MKKRKKLEEMDVLDDFLMNAVASDAEVGESFCRILLTILLGKRIGKLRIIGQHFLQGLQEGKRGIRMDVEVEEIKENDPEMPVLNVYDLEPHSRKKGENLLRRNRFYQAKIDAVHLKRGEDDFGKLPDLYVINLLDYDPFGFDYMLYTVHNKCDEVADLDYDDGLKFLYFNTKGTKGGSSEIKELLRFLQKSKADNVVNESIAKLYDCVENVKVKPEVQKGYMMLEEYIYYERKEAAEEAAAEATAETIISTTRENIIELLEELGEIPQDIQDRIEDQEDAAVLKRWLKEAAKTLTFEQFREAISSVKQGA